MNKRIKQLALEADEYCRDYVPNWDMNDYNLKFAELIVRECAKVIDADCELQYSEGITTNLGGLNQARELIKQHFGVEE